VDGGYQATFIKRISGADEMLAERYTMTLKKQGGAWKITDEKLEHTVDGVLYRSVPRDETYYKFDSFSFDREGLKISGGKGDLIVDYRNGEPFRFWFEGENPSRTRIQLLRLFRDNVRGSVGNIVVRS
jgi:hypothetical protein